MIKWLQGSPSQRASLEPAYILGDRKNIPEARNAVESVLRTELLDAIPKSHEDCVRHWAADSLSQAYTAWCSSLLPLSEMEFMPKDWDDVSKLPEPAEVAGAAALGKLLPMVAPRDCLG